MVTLLTMLVRAYQVTLSPLFTGCCRFEPSCSNYMIEALQVHGAVKGTWLGIRRLLRCHPFGPHGYDPVPPRTSVLGCLVLAAALGFEMDSTKFIVEPVRSFAAEGEWKYAREPLLTRLGDGSLYCAVFSGGEQEPGIGNCVLAVRSCDEGRTWTKSEAVLRRPDRACWATEIFDFGEGPEILFQTYAPEHWYAELRPWRAKLAKDGRGELKPVSFHGVPPNLSVRQGLKLSDGSLLFPVYWQENTDAWLSELRFPEGKLNWDRFDRRYWKFVSGVMRSTDGGKTWSVHGALGDGKVNSVWEPCAVELERGHVVMFARVSGEGQGVLWSAESRDYGVTWSKLAPTEIPNPDTKMQIFRHRDSIVLVNNTCEAGWFDRRRVEVWVSKTGMRDWKKTVVAEATKNSPRENFICYPSALCNDATGELYLMLDGFKNHYFLKIPYETLGM